MIDVTAMRWVAFVTTFLVGMCGLLVFPLKKLDAQRQNLVISYFNAFGAGVMISIGLIHLLHEAHEDLEKYYTFPMAFFLAGIGYGIIYFCEDVILVEIVNRYSSVLKDASYEVHSHGPTQRQSHANTHSHHESELCHTHSNPHGGHAHRMSLAGARSYGSLQEHHHEHHMHQYGPSETRIPEEDELLGHPAKSADSAADDLNEMRSTFVAFALQLVLSVHAVFEGLAMGASTTSENMLAVLLAILAHKGVEAFVIGSAFLKSTLSKRNIFFLMLLFALATPAGVMIGGIAGQEGADVAKIRGILVSLSAGSFIYVGSLLLEDDDHVGDCHDLKKAGSKTRFFLWSVGFGVFALYSYLKGGCHH
ncbi:hypothetical protein SARC_00793 [Sphaeroforma arctica JP610]|uniref:Zinc/iron permease n=1 Tax=Sphaeroforma arctica JP610 TaxID=667725 RepID=A0A0L0GDF9_9EUKA|nr:hypothetical protein SARC_00793 [Sphaeroforma arctica JP610]KNC87047.1 hypothetical protein SARC_00793 [Sphaeroforma arctica JP610]|eukprot:XP_014160949.1 hypothetical protein SARC_00793 [Sphaeroforma arctica JP610]